MVKIRNFRVSGRTCTQCHLRSRQPFHVFQENLILDVPHETKRPEHPPTVVFTETRRGVRPQGGFGIVQIFEVILTPEEEREIGIGCIGVRPCHGTSGGTQVSQLVVSLSGGNNLEASRLILHGLLPQKEVERVVVVQPPAIVGSCCLTQTENIG